MKILTKALIGTGVLTPVVGGLAFFGINKNKPVIQKPSFSKFWGDRVKILEEELVRLNKEGKDKAVALARKIDHQYGHIYFALRDDGNSLQEDPTFQNNALDKFCSNNNREKIGDELDRKLCGNIDYEHLD